MNSSIDSISPHYVNFLCACYMERLELFEDIRIYFEFAVVDLMRAIAAQTGAAYNKVGRAHLI